MSVDVLDYPIQSQWYLNRSATFILQSHTEHQIQIKLLWTVIYFHTKMSELIWIPQRVVQLVSKVEMLVSFQNNSLSRLRTSICHHH